MTKHTWVQMTMTVIEVEKQDNGNLHTFASFDAEDTAQEQAQQGCAFCGIPLTTATYDTECQLEVTPQK